MSVSVFVSVCAWVCVCVCASVSVFCVFPFYNMSLLFVLFTICLFFVSFSVHNITTTNAQVPQLWAPPAGSGASIGASCSIGASSVHLRRIVKKKVPDGNGPDVTKEMLALDEGAKLKRVVAHIRTTALPGLRAPGSNESRDPVIRELKGMVQLSDRSLARLRSYTTQNTQF